MPKVQFTQRAFQDLGEWNHQDKDVFDKIMVLIRDISRDPFKGLGKPEPLKGNFKGLWSRRITLEHRLVYEVQPDNILIHSCHGHYDD
jgi:toxin YoeB